MKIINLLIIVSSLFIGGHILALGNSTAAETKDFENVVTLLTDGWDSNGAVIPGACNATLVSPRTLVTAAHCVANAYQLKSFKAEIRVGKYKYSTKPDGTVVRIGYTVTQKIQAGAQFYFSQSVQNKLNNNNQIKIGPEEDLAVVVLNKDISTPSQSSNFTVISQRELQSALSNPTTLQPTIVSENPIAHISTNDTKRMASLNQLSVKSGFFTSNSISRVEPGDSGAPLFLKIGGSWKLAGVVKGRAETFFANWDVITLADSKICEISRNIGDNAIQASLCR